jgi:transposase
VSKTKQAYKYRFYPTDEQKRILAQTFGCCRFVYNWGLSIRKTAYFQHSQKLTYDDLSAMLPALKQEHPWLADVSSVPIQQSLRHLDRAYKNFFEGRAKYPTFKMRNDWQKLSVGMPRRRKVPRIGRKHGARWPVCMLVSMTVAATTSTNFRHASSTKTK